MVSVGIHFWVSTLHCPPTTTRTDGQTGLAALLAARHLYQKVLKKCIQTDKHAGTNKVNQTYFFANVFEFGGVQRFISSQNDPNCRGKIKGRARVKLGDGPVVVAQSEQNS